MKKLLILSALLLLVTVSCKKRPKSYYDITTQQTLAGEKIPLRVTLVSPSGSVEGERETFKILVGFNQTMTPLQAIPRDETRGPLEFDPPVKGKYRWMGSRTLAFIPADTLQPATAYTVTLKKDRIQSLTGMRLDSDTAWNFESVRPCLLNSLPYYSSTFVDIDGAIYLQFNMPMAPEKVKGKITITANHAMPSYVYCGNVEPSFPPYQEDIPFSVRTLRDSEKKDWPLKDWINDNSLVLVPTRPFPVESQIEVIMQSGLMAKTGNLGTSDERTMSFNTYNVFALIGESEEITGGYSLDLCFSNPVAINELVKFIEFDPPIDSIPQYYVDETYTTTEPHLYLPFKLNRDYMVRISRKLKDQFGNNLNRDYDFSVHVGDYLPFAEIPTGVNIVESRDDLKFPATFVNVDTVNLAMGIVDLDNAVPFLNQPDVFNAYSEYAAPEIFSVSRSWAVNTFKKNRNKKIRLPILLKDVLQARQAGLVYLQFDNLGQYGNYPEYRYLKAFVETGDIGVTWKYAPENNMVWITSLSDTRPIGSARVQFRDNQNNVLWQGFTDTRGLCEFPGWAEFRMKTSSQTYESESEYELDSYTSYYEPKFWLTVSRGDDRAVYSNQWYFGIDPWRFNISYNWNVQAEEYDGYIFTEKGLYKSGETVHVNGIIRKKRKGEWTLPPASKATCVIRNSRDEEIFNGTVSLGAFGSFALNLGLADDAATGPYSIRTRLEGTEYSAYGSFRVEAYRPAEFEVKAYAERDTFFAGETFKGSVAGRYLFGMPMRDAQANWDLHQDYRYVSFPAHKDYSFGGYYEEISRGVLGSGRGKLDDKGSCPVKVKLSAKDITSPVTLTLEGTVTAPNKQTLSGRQNWIAFPSNLLIGLKTSSFLYVLGDTVELSTIAINQAGTKLANKKIDISVVKREWQSIKKARLGGRYEWVSEMVDKEVKKEKTVSRLDSTLIRLIPDTPGYYYVDAQSRDDKGRRTATRIYYYIAGGGYAGWEMRDDDIIELVPDRNKYEVGDTARILIKSPYDSAEALVTIERELVMRKFTKKLRGNADYIEVPIRSIDLPNIYVCVTLLRGRVKDQTWDEEKQEDLGKPQFKMGYANLAVDTKEKHLAVKAYSDRAEYRPRDSVNVFFDVNDYRGKPPADCEISLFVVDLGVLNLIDYSTPDPFAYFYGPRSLSVRTIESRVNILGERNYGEKGEERGGGGMEAAPAQGIPYRQKFLATVFYKASLKTDKQGKGKVGFVLPDNLTKFRIMLVAQTRTSEFGSAESTFTVNLPFIVTGSVPRFARVGDAFDAGVVLHNRTDTENRASVECTAQGIKLSAVKSSREVVLKPNGSAEVLFPFTAEKTGNAVFKFRAAMGKEQDALQLTIPVKLPPFVEAVATFSSTADSALEGIIVPDNIFESLGKLDIYLSSSVLAGMKRGIDHLLDYPYGCLEQRLSRVLPLIVGEGIINQFKLAPVTGKALRDTVQKVIDEVHLYQAYNGGFLYFKESIYPCPYLSAYTMYVLKRARDAGYVVDQAMTDRGTDFLELVLRWGDYDWTYPYNEDARLTTLSFCVYSLSIWGKKEPSYASKLFERRDQIPIFGKTLLMKAGRNCGMGERFESELARIITNKIKMSPTTAHFEESDNRGGWTFPSPAKVTGFVIQTFTELDIAFPYKDQVIRWLVSERGKRTRPTTHENAFVFDAFQTYYTKYEKEEPDFVAKVLLGEKEIIKRNFKGRTSEPPQYFSFSLDEIKKNELLPIRIKKDGSGRLYYTLRMFYAFKENPIAFDEGFYVWKEILSLEGREVKKFKRGEVYKVVLHVVVPETRIFAVVDDPLPAGFEPVQTFFATESRAVQEQYWSDQYQEAGHWWGSFDHEEQYDDRMLFFAQELFPGEHTQIYYVRAGTEGTFLAPATKAEEMYEPEVFGSTTQKFVEIE
jgi:uncharacterized protein YfaS (alpha-2-macroglobulin family)